MLKVSKDFAILLTVAAVIAITLYISSFLIGKSEPQKEIYGGSCLECVDATEHTAYCDPFTDAERNLCNAVVIVNCVTGVYR